MRKLWICLLLASLLLPGCYGYRVRRVTGWNTRSQVAATPRTLSSLRPNDYFTRLLRSPDSPESALYIPNYAYYQGIVYSPSGVVVIGQVRLVGGLASGGDVALREGAMATACPDAFRGRVNPSRYRYYVSEWQEVP